MTAEIPYDKELEQLVLGSLLIDDKAIHRVVAMLHNREIFYEEKHRLIYDVLIRFYQEGTPIDMMTVSQQLRAKDYNNVPPVTYLVDLSTKVASTANLEYHCQLLMNLHVRRVVIQQTDRLRRAALEHTMDATEMLTKVQHTMDLVQDNIYTHSDKSFDDILAEVMEDVERLSNRQGEEVTGISTGLNQLNHLTNGWQKGDLVIIAGRPGMGKTAFAVKQIMECARQDRPVVIFELEMRQVDMGKRLICQHDPFFHANMLFKHGLKKGEHFERLASVKKQIRDLPIHIETTPGMNIFDATVKATRLKQKYNDLGLIVLDYLQLMQGFPGKRYGNREQEISEVSRYLKKLALDLEVPIIALSQLSRDVERRGGSKRPVLSDLRESGSIEQDADLVLFLYRPEYYGIDSLEDGTPSDGVAEIIISKHRSGECATAQVGFNDNRIRFDELSVVLEQKRAADIPF